MGKPEKDNQKITVRQAIGHLPSIESGISLILNGISEENIQLNILIV